jgi:putative ABC transport system ATP-binding protein
MLSIENASKLFVIDEQTRIYGLKEISLSIQKDDFLILIGSNGSGKSTLLNVISGHIILDSGRILLNGKEITHLSAQERSKIIVRIAQNPATNTIAELSVVQNFRLAYLRKKNIGLRKAVTTSFYNEVKEKVAVLNMGLEKKLNQEMGKLSGGQRQALSLLMYTWHKPELLLLDEPTAALDVKSADTVMNIVQKITKEYKIPCILITHNLKDMIQYGNRLIQLHQGKIVRNVSENEKTMLSAPKILSWLSD